LFQDQLYSELAYVSLSHIDSWFCSSRYFSFLAFIYSLHYTHMTRFMLISNKINDKFAAQIIEALCNEARHHNKISLIECKEYENHLYFQERKYVLNSDKLRLRIIQLTYDSVINDHSERAKSYKLISWIYWWSNIYKYVQCFVQNCHVCTRFKLSKQWTQE